jgi:hypothetical protein
MPKGPNGQKRPADVIGAAIMVARIATGEVEDTSSTNDDKDAAAKALGAKGGAARAARLTPAERSGIARNAAKLRWAAKPKE